MPRPPSLTICLVRPPGPARDAWPVDRLAAELADAGQRVEVTQSLTDRELRSPDVLHCFGLAAAREASASEPSTRLLVTPSDCDALEAVSDADAPFLAASASAVVRSTKDQERVHRLGLPWSRIWVLPVAVDVDTFSRRGPMANRTEKFRIVVRAGGTGDGVEDLLVAMTKLDDVETVVLVDDDGSDADLSRRVDALREFAARIGVADRLAFATPSSPGERAWWMRSAHVAVAVPRSMRPNEFVAEAMACGTPVVATAVDALADLVVHGVTGFHVRAGSPVSVARAVRMVLQDDFTVEAYGLAAADRALSRFAWPRVAHELLGVYRRVAAVADELEVHDDVDDEVLEDAELGASGRA